MADFDSPWKEALDVYFQAFLAFFYPHIHTDIDWSRGVEMLDKELQQIAPRAAQGRRYVDKLVKVYRRNGRPVWVLIHVEVQTQPDRTFGQRMHQYNTRIADHYNRTVVSLAVLADDNPNWRPSGYRRGLWGCTVGMTFPPAKLLDYAGREAELERDKNPFARVVLAHLKALQTRRDPAGRRDWKLRLVRGLFEQKFAAEDVRQLFRLIDWLMELPPVLDKMFWGDVEAYQQEQTVPFLTTPERLAIQKGLLQGIEDILLVRFGEAGVALLPRIEELYDIEKYRAVNRTAATAVSLDEVRQAVAEAAAPPPKKKRGKRGPS